MADELVWEPRRVVPPKPSKYLLRDSTITGTEIDPPCVTLPIEANVFADARDPVALDHILATPRSTLSSTMGPSVGPGESLNRRAPAPKGSTGSS
jgi:hypothetical protein